MKQHKVIISGGGTGGHIFPALAIGSALKQRYADIQLLFVGAIGKMEMQQVPKAGFPIRGLWIGGFQRSFALRNLLFPLKLIVSLIQSTFILLHLRPQVVVGTGGFASGALLKVAQWMGYPTLIQEQNSFPGITNKLLGHKAYTICVGFESMENFFPKEKIVFTGNPVRQQISEAGLSSTAAKSHFNLNPKKKVLAILGGSLGAKAINELIAFKQKFIEASGFQILWQCGKLYYEQYAHLASATIVIKPFVSNMNAFYAAADMLIARAGAGTIAELCCVAKPVILIPSPNVTANHQVKNAEALVRQKAAVMIEEKNLDTDFEIIFTSLNENQKQQHEMHTQLTALAKPEATAQIVDEIEKMMRL